MKIILIQQVLPNYRKELFEVMREKSLKSDNSFDLLVSAHSDEFLKRGPEITLPWASLISIIKLPAWLGGFEYQFVPWREILAADVVIVPDAMRSISNLLVLLIRRFSGKPVILWGHGLNFQKKFLASMLSGIRIRLLRIADFNILYTQASLEPFLTLGFDQKAIGLSENAVDTTLAAGLHAQHPDVLAFREAHDLANKPCVVFLGSWYSYKRPKMLIKISLALRQKLPEVQVLVIGGGKGLHQLEKMAEKLSWIKLLGPLYGRDKFIALSAGHCLVVSGKANLSLLDAMAVGLPVVVPQRSDHSPEIEYVRDGINGLMVLDDTEQLSEACRQLIINTAFHVQLSEGARRTSANLTIENMAQNILSFSNNFLDKRPVVFVYQRMLPYHKARFKAISDELLKQGRACKAVEAASFDSNYGDIDDSSNNWGELESSVVRLFNNRDYLDLKPKEVACAVFGALSRLSPSVIFSPAPAFAEGAGSLHYKIQHDCRLILMDDAWSMTERKSRLVRLVKKSFYGYMDGGFFPSRLHGQYFNTINIPYERQGYNVNVVGALIQDYVVDKDRTYPKPEQYLLYVGRLTQRKGLDVLLKSITTLTPPVQLVVIGDGPYRDTLKILAAEMGLAERVKWIGRCSNFETRLWIAKAQALLVPSFFEQWSLVVNEAWMEETLVLGSDTVGSLRAEYHGDMKWMLIEPGNVDSWRKALSRLLDLSTEERLKFKDKSRQLAEKYSLDNHIQSALDLLTLPKRRRPIALVGWLALKWQGKVVVW